MARVVSLVEFPSLPSGARRYATMENTATEEAVDELGQPYELKLVGHPEVAQSLSDTHSGIIETGELTIELANLDQAASDAFRDEVRDTPVILRRKYLDTGTVAHRFRGPLDSVVFAPNGAIRITATDHASKVLGTLYPKQIVDPLLVGKLVDEGFATETPISTILGAVREHTPCRYVEGNELASYYRYIVCNGFWPLYDMTTYPLEHGPLVRPYINSLYRGYTGGALLISPGEYEQEWVANAPTLVSAGFTADPVITTPNGGTLDGPVTYRVHAYNKYGLIASSDAVVSGAFTDRKATITWTPVHNALFYRVEGRNGSPGILATICGHDTVTWEDDGSLTPFTGTLPDPDFTVPNWTGGTPSIPNSISAIFRSPQYGAASQLSPILADVETTELGPTPYTKSLFLFRGDIRNFATGATLQHANQLRTSRFMHLWSFKGTFSSGDYLDDTVGSATLTGTDVTQANLVAGQHFGEQVLRLPASVFGLTLSGAGSVDMAFNATTSFRFEATIRPDAAREVRTFCIVSRGGVYDTIAGYALIVEGGTLIAIVIDTTGRVVKARSTTRFAGAYHDVAFEVDRVNAVLRLEVDGVVEDTQDIMGLGSLATPSPYDTFRIGGADNDTWFFVGDIDRVAVLTGFGSPWAFGQGKANSGTNALDLSLMWEPPWIPDAISEELDPGTQPFFWQGWVRPFSIQAAGGGALGAKTDSATSGVALFLIDNAGTGRAKAEIIIGGVTYVVHSSSAFLLDRWNLVSLLVLREAPGVPGSIQLFLNGILAGQVALPAGTPTAITAPAPFVVGALHNDGACKLDGLLDELHVEIGIPTTAGHPGVRGLAAHRHCWLMGRRNGIRYLRTILSSHDFNESLSATAFDTAEDAWDAIEAGALVADYAAVEQTALGEHLRHIMRLRGVRLGLDATGAWAPEVDTNQAIIARFGHRDGDLGNVVARPQWSTGKLAEAFKTLRIRYRRKRKGGDEVDRFVRKAPPRSVLTVGADEPATPAEFPAIRDDTAGDITGDYTAKLWRHADSRASFPCGEDAAQDGAGVRLGLPITLIDPTAGIPESDPLATRRVYALRDRGTAVDLDTVGWGTDLYTYTPAVDTINEQIECIEEEIDVDPESAPDFSSTPPPPVSAVNVVFDADRLATVSWTPPVSPNYQGAQVSWRRKPAGNEIVLFVISGITEDPMFVIAGIPKPGEFEIRVESRNRHGILGAGIIVDATAP